MAKKLLFPTDFSELSIHTLREVVQLNEKLNDEIIVLHAYSRPVSEKTGKSPLLAKEKRVDEKFEKLLHEVPELRKHPFEFKKKLGYSTDVILSEVRESVVELIVMSTKGAFGVGELFGTKTAEIMDKVNVPIIVMPKTGSLGSIRRIGLASDFSASADPGKLDFICRLAEKTSSEIMTITVNRDQKNLSKKELTRRDAILQKMGNILSSVNYVYETSKERGLIRFCKKNDIDLLAILPRSYNFIEKLFHESLTRRMAFQSPVSLLVLK